MSDHTQNYIDLAERGEEIPLDCDEVISEKLKVGTAVQPSDDQQIKNESEFQSYIADSNDPSQRKFDGYRNPICDSTTVSSKKVSSTSPPNDRSPKGESPISSVIPMKKSKSNASKTGPNYSLQEISKKDKSKSGIKRKKRSYESVAKARATKGIYNTGRWTKLEHFKFLEALKMFGKEWQKVQQHVNTRTSTQARSHAQKFF